MQEASNALSNLLVTNCTETSCITIMIIVIITIINIIVIIIIITIVISTKTRLPTLIYWNVIEWFFVK